MPEKLDRCVADVKAKGGVDNPWAVCVASTGEKPNKELKEEHNLNVSSKLDIPFDTKKIKTEVAESIVREKINDNRQVPFFNPPITNRDVKPKIDKTTKSIGGQVGKIDSDSNTNNMTTDLWKKIFDSQLRRNVKEPRY